MRGLLVRFTYLEYAGVAPVVPTLGCPLAEEFPTVAVAEDVDGVADGLDFFARGGASFPRPTVDPCDFPAPGVVAEEFAVALPPDERVYAAVWLLLRGCAALSLTEGSRGVAAPAIALLRLRLR